jgi:hypothetical protein
MGRSFSDLVRFASVFLSVSLIVALPGCSSSSPTRNAPFPVPANIVLAPAGPVSLDVGSATQTFTATPQNNMKTTITTPVTFVSSNTAVLTIANSGAACAGTWDSLSTPQICTPGPVGVAEVTATSHGVSSPPTTVYVHQHIDKIVISAVPGQTPPAGPCFSKGQTFNYQATALSRGLDITASVGAFTWQALTSDVATLTVTTANAPVSGLLPGQAQVTAHTPGVTSLFASTSNVNSEPLDFTTCAVKSITLAVTGSDTNSINVTSGTGKTVTATVVDTLGSTLTAVPLSWCSSQSATVGAGGTGTNCSSNANDALAFTTAKAGGGTVTASCTPPTCNIGFQPLLPIYPEAVVDVVVAPSGTTTTTAATTTVYVSSTGISSSGNCATITGCVSTLIPITAPTNTVGTAISLPATPNSLVFDRQGTNAYLGTDFGFFGSRGLMMVAGTTVSEFKSVTGKVLALSPDGKNVIVSDTKSTPNQVFVFDTTSKTSVTLPISGATAADYSPDNLKAFIVAGTNLYVYSRQDSLKTIALAPGAPANNVSFFPEGAFAFVGGGSTTSSVTAWSTCGLSSVLTSNVILPGTPSFLKALARDLPGLADPGMANATTIASVLAVDPPGLDLFRVATTPAGCSPTVSPGIPTSFNLGQGNFVPKQLLVSQDGARAYVIASNLGSVLVFNIGNQTSSAIPLSGDAIPIQASLTADGNLLYIAAADGQVHVLDTQAGGDVRQISFPTDASTLQGGLCTGVTFTCNPDLIAVKP